MDRLVDPNAWAAFAALFSLEVVLGIDNVVFVAILANRLPRELAPRARLIGLSIALLARLLLLYSIEWLEHLTDPAFAIGARPVSWRDLVLFAGGLFLVAKATKEIHGGVEGREEHADPARAAGSFAGVVGQIVLIDIVFSLDSVITAVGMADDIAVMIAAIVAAMVVMLLAAGAIARFIEQNPTLKMLALAFLMMVGVSLMADGGGLHVPRGYIYAAMGFSLTVETLNLLAARNRRRAAGPRANDSGSAP